MSQKDAKLAALQKEESFLLLLLCLPITIVSAIGIRSLLNLASVTFQLEKSSGALWGLGSVLFLLAFVALVAIWKYVHVIFRLNDKERGLRRNSVMMEGFFENNPSCMWVKDLEGNYSLVNKTFRENSGSDEIPKEGAAHLKDFMEKNVVMMEDQDKQVLKFKSPMEFEAIWHNGDMPRNYSILRFPLINEEGEVFAIGGIANDRTDQVSARRALRESEKQFRALVESAADAIFIANDQGDILLANKQAERLFLLSRGQLIKSNLKTLLPELDLDSFPKPNSNGLALVDDRASEQNLISMLAVDSEGNNIPVEAAISATETESGTTNTCIVRDVSDRMKLEAQLRESQKMDAIGKLTGGMAHDFNNLLGVVMGNIDLAIRKLDPQSPLLNRLQTAKKAGARGAELTQRMLAVARRQPLKPKPNSLKDIVDDMGDMLPRTLGPDIEMRYDICSSLPDVLVDRSGLENVILNLAINSAHAMPDGGKFVISARLLHLTKDSSAVEYENMSPGQYVQVSIMDTGVGMDEITVSRAFEPFFSTKERDKGSGLGLAMVYGFAKQSGGNVHISSEVGRGTNIDIFLPASKVAAKKKPLSKILGTGLNGKASGKVLVVDDESDLLEVTTSYVRELGFNVLPASDGNLALEMLQQNPDIEYLLTDVVMPGGINGVALAQEVRKRLPNIKILYMSGFPSGVIADKSGIELDAPLLTKPFTFEDLISAMDELICEAAA